MMDFNLTQQVRKKQKRSSKLLGRIMVVFAVILVFFGIIFNRGFFFPAFLFAFLYYIFGYGSDSAYEYNFEILKTSSFLLM